MEVLIGHSLQPIEWSGMIDKKTYQINMTKIFIYHRHAGFCS